MTPAYSRTLVVEKHAFSSTQSRANYAFCLKARQEPWAELQTQALTKILLSLNKKSFYIQNNW